MTSDALVRALLIEQNESRRTASARLGFTQLNYGRLFIRDYWTLFAIAVELGCTIEELASPPERQITNGSSVRFADLESAATRILDEVRQLPAPQREVLLLRASGLSLRQITTSLKGRSYHGIAEDLADGVVTIFRRCESEVKILAGAEQTLLLRNAQKDGSSQAR